jgi:hypothetical protein
VSRLNGRRAAWWRLTDNGTHAKSGILHAKSGTGVRGVLVQLQEKAGEKEKRKTSKNPKFSREKLKEKTFEKSSTMKFIGPAALAGTGGCVQRAACLGGACRAVWKHGGKRSKTHEKEANFTTAWFCAQSSTNAAPERAQNQAVSPRDASRPHPLYG